MPGPLMGERVERLFPPGVIVDIDDGTGDPPSLHPLESPCVKRAVAKRRIEFARGRGCARRAMAALGIAPTPLLVRPDRSPDWPSHVVGSITHCDGLTIAAVTRLGVTTAVGVDAEPAIPLEEDLFSMVCTRNELDGLRRLASGSRGRAAKLLFCAKEALYKCVSQEHPRLDFLDVNVRVHTETDAFTVSRTDGTALTRLSAEVIGRFLDTGTFVIAGCTVSAGSSDGQAP